MWVDRTRRAPTADPPMEATVERYLRHTVLGIVLALGWGCGDESMMSPVGAAGTAAGPGLTAGTTAAPPTAAGTSAAGTAAPTGAAGKTPQSDPPGSTAGKPAAAGGTGASGTGAAVAGMPATTGGMAGMAAGMAGMNAAAAGTGAAVPNMAGSLPHVTTTEGMGPWGGVTKMKNVGPGGWLIFPKDIGKDGVKHPLFVFGPGGGTTPQPYEDSGKHWDYYGSYGLVIYAVQMSGQSGAPMKAAIDWLIKQNDEMSSPLYQKLDTTKICAAGHSMGSVMTFAAMPDERVTTTIHISGGSFDGMGPSKLTKDTMFLCGPSQSADVAFPQCETDFKNTKVPTFYTNIQGSSHLTSGRMGWPAITAWMLWHLAGHEEWKKEFLDPTGMFRTGMLYKSQVKNFH